MEGSGIYDEQAIMLLKCQRMRKNRKLMNPKKNPNLERKTNIHQSFLSLNILLPNNHTSFSNLWQETSQSPHITWL